MLIRKWTEKDNFYVSQLEKICFSDPWTEDMVESAQKGDNFIGEVAICMDGNDEKIACQSCSSDCDDCNTCASDCAVRSSDCAVRSSNCAVCASEEKNDCNRDIDEREIKSEEKAACNSSEEKVIGYVGAVFGADEADIALIAVAPQYRRKNVALSLMHSITRILNDKGVKKIFLEVRVSNAAARSLYEKCGFKPVGLRKKYYSDTEDAIVMVKV